MNTEPTVSVVKLTMDGVYSPADYFEAPVRVDGEGYTVEISNGKVEVTLKRTEPLPEAGEQAGINRAVRLIFQARCIQTAKPYEFNGLGLKRYKSDGTRDVWVSVKSIISVSMVATPDIVQTDKDGNVTRDTKAERLAEHAAFIEQCLKHGDNASLERLMVSFWQATADPADMFVHLYEIRDALKDHFGGEDKVKKTLGISQRAYSDFGQLANNTPVEESRHRGSHQTLRPATEEERQQGLSFARSMIERYVVYLDQDA